MQQVDVTADVALEHEGGLLLLTLLPTGFTLHPGREGGRERGREGEREGGKHWLFQNSISAHTHNDTCQDF